MPQAWANWFGAVGRALWQGRVSLLVSIIFALIMNDSQAAEALRNAFGKFESVDNGLFGWAGLVVMGFFFVLVGASAGAQAMFRQFPDYDQTMSQAPSGLRWIERKSQYPHPAQIRGSGAFVAWLISAIAPLGAMIALVRASDIENLLGPGGATYLTLLVMAAICGGLALILLIAAVAAARQQMQVVQAGVVGWARASQVLCWMLAISLFLVPHAFDNRTHFLLVSWSCGLHALLSWLAWLGEKIRFPVLGTLVLAALTWAVTGASDNHTLRHAATAPVSAPAAPAFAQWLESRKPEIDAAGKAGRKYPVFLVAAEGGGIRAAYMTFDVLTRLKEAHPEFPAHTFAVIGVSGGSLGAAMFNASQVAPGATGLCGDGDVVSRMETAKQLSPEAAGRAALSADLLSPALHGLLGPRFFLQVLPLRWLGWDGLDNARDLEDGVDYAWRRTGQAPLRPICFGAAWRGPGGDLPALILLGTDVRTGERIAASHLTFGAELPQDEWIGVAPTTAAAHDCRTPGDNKDARLRTLAEEMPGTDVPLLSAALMSARFPIISPAARLPCPGAARRVVDGGYFENSGVTTLLELSEAMKPYASKVRLIVIRIENSAASTDFPWQRPQPGGTKGGFDGLTPSSVRALMGARNARATQAVATLRREYPQTDRASFTLAPGPIPIPLGWWIGPSAQQEIGRQVAGPGHAAEFKLVADALAKGETTQRR